MKQVYKTNDFSQAVGIRALLESAGIPANMTEHGINNRTSIIPRGHEVWIFFDAQFEDAKALIENPEHEVSEPIDVTAFYQDYNSKENQQIMQTQMSHILMYGVFGIFLLLGLIYLLVQ